MEARVHFLTEDKIKLSDDIRQYVEKIATDFEQKERLSIEADIWRSKFLASRYFKSSQDQFCHETIFPFSYSTCSVVIEELTKWKSVLCKRNDDLQLCVKGLISEMDSISTNQQQIHKYSGKIFQRC